MRSTQSKPTMAGAVVLRAASSAVARLAAAAGIAMIAPSTTAGESPPVAAFVRRLALPAPAITQFVEIRYSALLTRPLSTSGELEYRGSHSLHKRILVPYREQQVVDGDQVTVQREGERSRSFSLKRTPELKGILDSLGALFAGDMGSLERSFAVTLEEAASGWVLRLVPRNVRARQQLQEIVVTGRTDQPDCFVTSEPDGDASFMLLGEASRVRLPDPLARAWIEEHCRVPQG